MRRARSCAVCCSPRSLCAPVDSLSLCSACTFVLVLVPTTEARRDEAGSASAGRLSRLDASPVAVARRLISFADRPAEGEPRARRRRCSRCRACLEPLVLALTAGPKANAEQRAVQVVLAPPCCALQGGALLNRQRSTLSSSSVRAFERSVRVAATAAASSAPFTAPRTRLALREVVAGCGSRPRRRSERGAGGRHGVSAPSLPRRSRSCTPRDVYDSLAATPLHFSKLGVRAVSQSPRRPDPLPHARCATGATFSTSRSTASCSSASPARRFPPDPPSHTCTQAAQHACLDRPPDFPPRLDLRKPHRRRSRAALVAGSSRTGPLPGRRAERRRGRGRHVEEERGRAHVHRRRSRNRWVRSPSSSLSAMLARHELTACSSSLDILLSCSYVAYSQMVRRDPLSSRSSTRTALDPDDRASPAPTS